MSQPSRVRQTRRSIKRSQPRQPSKTRKSITRSHPKPSLSLGLGSDTSTIDKRVNAWIAASQMSTALPNECLVGKRMGTDSSAGEIFEHPLYNDRVLKVIPGSIDAARKEFAYGQLIHSLGIGGKFYKMNICGTNAHLTIERFDGTLSEFIKKPKKFSVKRHHLIAAGLQIKRLIAKLHKYGLYHGDIHLNNFMFKKTKDGKFKWFIIDFGFVHTKNRPINRVSYMNKQSQYAPKDGLMISDFLRYIPRAKLGEDPHYSLGHTRRPYIP